MKCLECRKEINKKEHKYVLVGTYFKEKTEEEAFFHFQCWLDHFNKAVMKRIGVGTGVAMDLLSGALSNLGISVKNGK